MRTLQEMTLQEKLGQRKPDRIIRGAVGPQHAQGLEVPGIVRFGQQQQPHEDQHDAAEDLDGTVVSTHPS